ncbi:acyl-CoA dehydrogenase family protein [Pseudonocardia acaciae]|uniref:acyl-CoA dehydrogenase family protein n=1 Tax=Pseudonocardia acaciae TaxID=551276 RepID=UPI00048E22D9|nr:acyl-CoA dehydrogenase family protein [Pseudonocardia acaciae]
MTDELLSSAVGELLADRCGRDVVAAAERTGWAPELWAALAEGGFPWVSVPEQAGGVGGSVADACAVLEQAGRYAAPVPVAETGLLAGWLLARAGLPIPTGGGPLTTAHGQVTLRADGRAWRASGEVRRVPWARSATRIVLLADAPDGLHVVSVDPAHARIQPGANLAGEPRDTVRLDDTEVERAPAPDGVDAPALELRGALSRSALIAGAGRRVLDITVAYTNRREQFGRPVARFQAVAAHLVRLAEQAEAAAMAARAAAFNAATGEPEFVDVAAAKTVASEAAGLIAAAAHQATGAMGMTSEYELGQLTRRLWSWREEYGGERTWSTRLGATLADTGADALWPTIARGAHR